MILADSRQFRCSCLFIDPASIDGGTVPAVSKHRLYDLTDIGFRFMRAADLVVGKERCQIRQAVIHNALNDRGDLRTGLVEVDLRCPNRW